MIRKWFLALLLGATLVGSAPPQRVLAQGSGTLGSNGGLVKPGTSAKNVVADSAAGSAGSAPETSLSTRGAGEPATREGDAPNQILTLAPYAFLLALFLAVALYFFVFRKPTTTEGDAATDQNTANNESITTGSDSK